MKHALIVFSSIASILCAGRLTAAEPAATQPLPPAAQEAVQAYQAALKQAGAERDDKILQAWRDVDIRLEAVLADVMKRGDLEDANRITTLRAALKAEYFAGNKPARAPDPKSTAAVGIRIELSRTVAGIHAQYATAVDRHGKAYFESLDALIKAAMKEGKLDEANRIAAWKKKALVVPGGPPGRFPPGAMVAFSMDRDTFFKKDGKEFVRDLSGNDNHAVATNVSAAPGRIGTAIAFSGQGSHLITLRPVGINDDQTRTMAFWLRCERVPGGKWRHFAGWGEGQAAKRQFRASLVEGKFLLWSYGAGHDWYIPRGPEVKVWQHHAITYDGKNTRWYIDGEPLKLTFPITYRTGDSPVTIGNVDLAIDELAIYNRVLTDLEIHQLSNRPEK